MSPPPPPHTHTHTYTYTYNTCTHTTHVHTPHMYTHTNIHTWHVHTHTHTHTHTLTAIEDIPQNIQFCRSLALFDISSNPLLRWVGTTPYTTVPQCCGEDWSWPQTNPSMDCFQYTEGDMHIHWRKTSGTKTAVPIAKHCSILWCV